MEQDIYLYPGSQSEAHRLGEAALWDASFHANVSCARDIEAVIRVYADKQELEESIIRRHYGTIVMDSEQPQGGGTSAGGMAQGIQAAPDSRKTVFRP